MEILRPLAGAEVDAEARRGPAGPVEEAGVLHGLTSGGQGESRVGAAFVPARGVLHIAVELKVLDFGAETGGKSAGVEMGDGADAAAAGDLRGEQFVHTVGDRRNSSHACDDDAAFHTGKPSALCRVKIRSRVDFGFPP